MVSASCEPDLCARKTDLVVMERWQRVPPEEDPFSPPPEAFVCDDAAFRVAPFGAGGPLALDVDTGAACGWATAAQPLVADVAPGDELVLRVFYFTQTTFPASEAQLALRIGDDVVWSATVPIPAESGLVPRAPFAVQTRAPEGTPVFFHVGNHGDNAWNLLEVARVRQEACSDAAEDGDNGG